MKGLRHLAGKYRYPLILLALTMLFFWKIFAFPDYVFYSPFSDLTSQDFFWKRLIHETFQNYGELPLWNPYIFSGMPFLANHFSKIFYPPNLLFLFFSNIGLLFNYLYLAHYFFAGLFLYLFARKIGLDRFSSFVSSIIYAFSGHFVMYVYIGLTNELPMMVFFPLTLYLFECAIRENKLFYSALTGISLSMIIFGTHVQKLIYTYLFLFAYFLFRVTAIAKNKEKISAKRVAAICFFAVAVSVLVSAIQLLPSIEILKYDTRAKGIDYDFATLGSFPPIQLITAAIPNFFGTLLHNNYWGLFPFWAYTIYLGIFPLVLALFSLKSRGNAFVRFFIITLAVSLFLALGKYNPFYYFIYSYVPIINYLRAPARILFFYVFSIAILAGFGANWLTGIKTKPDKSLKKLIIFLLVVAVFSMLILAGAFLLKGRILELGDKILESKYSRSHAELGLNPIDYYKGKIEGSFLEIRNGIAAFIMILSGIIIALYLRFKNLISMNSFKVSIAAIIIADLFLFSMPFIDLKSLDFVYTQNEIPSFLANDKGYFRVLDLAESLPQTTAIKHDLKSVNGYDGMVLYYYREYASEMAGIPFFPSPTIAIKDIKYDNMLDLLNVKYIISGNELKGSRHELLYKHSVYVYTNNQRKIFSDRGLKDPIFEFSHMQTNYVYKNKNFLPKAFVVGDYAVADRNKILSILKSKDFEPRKYVILEEETNKKQTKNMFEEAKIEFYSPNRVIVNANIKEPGFLVLSEIWYPGWEAFDNGKETKIYRANYMFRAVYLDSGYHKIEFVFNPLSYKIGKWITIATLIGLAAYFILFSLSKD